MENNDLGRVGCADQALVASDQAATRLDPSGFDPSRWRRDPYETEESLSSCGMVERVARGMWHAKFPPEFATKQYPSKFPPEGHAERLLIMASARGAIEAMWEPLSAMIEAAANTPGMKAADAAMQIHQARGYGFEPGSFDDGSPLHQAWRAMIAAALRDSDRNPEGGDANAAPSRSDESAVPERQSP